MKPVYGVAKLPLVLLRPSTDTNKFIEILEPIFEEVLDNLRNVKIDLYTYAGALIKAVNEDETASSFFSFLSTGNSPDNADGFIHIHDHGDNVLFYLYLPKEIQIH